MALFRGIHEYIALDANNITLVFDSGNIVNISGNTFLYPPQGHPILYINIPQLATPGGSAGKSVTMTTSRSAAMEKSKSESTITRIAVAKKHLMCLITCVVLVN